MRYNYRLQDYRCCDNCAYSDLSDQGMLICYRHPASHKNDERRVQGGAVCDDHEYTNETGTLIDHMVWVFKWKSPFYGCRIKVKQ